MNSIHRNRYCYIISHAFRAVVSTNDGPLSLPGGEAVEMANSYNAAYPGTNFEALYTTSPQHQEYAANYIQLPIDPNNTGGLCWSILSKLEWLERLADNPSMLSWLSENCRQS